jgi:hypothetical protein
MSYLQLDSTPVISGTIPIPLNGRLTADLKLAITSAPPAAGKQVTLTFEGGQAYKCTVERSGPQGGFQAVRLVGGSGGLSKQVPSRYYQGIPAATVIKDLLGECGEAVGDIDLPSTLAFWVRPEGPAHEALRALMMRYPERIWQVAPNGKVNILVPTWPDYPGELNIETEQPAAGSYLAGADPRLTPGVRLNMRRGIEKLAKRVTRVTHLIGRHLRVEIGTGDGTDLGAEGLNRVIGQSLRWVDYLGLFPCRVLKDWGDMTLDLRPENPLLPEMTHVRLVPPIAGVRVKLKKDSVVILAFQSADPARPLVISCPDAVPELFELITGKGQIIRADDDRGQTSEDGTYAAPHILLQDQAGQSVRLDPHLGITAIDKAGSVTKMDGKGNIRLTATVHVSVDAPTVSIAGPGGSAVGRVGDQVQVTGVMLGGSTVTGTIITGSPKVVSG